MPEWNGYGRAAVRGDIEEASGQALPVNDPLPDMLIADAQAADVSPGVLRIRIYDEIAAMRAAAMQEGLWPIS